MPPTKKLERTQIPDEFRDSDAKKAMVAHLNRELSSCEPGSDDYQSTTNKIRKAQATPVRRKKRSA